VTIWIAVLIGCAAVYSWKLLGFLVPQKILHNEVIARVASLVTVALLSGLVGIESLVSNGAISFDARIPAIAVAVVLLLLRQSFIVVVLAGAAVAALIRLF
jgi:branched-subunit amino acid transport protein